MYLASEHKCDQPCVGQHEGDDGEKADPTVEKQLDARLLYPAADGLADTAGRGGGRGRLQGGKGGGGIKGERGIKGRLISCIRLSVGGLHRAAAGSGR